MPLHPVTNSVYTLGLDTGRRTWLCSLQPGLGSRHTRFNTPSSRKGRSLIRQFSNRIGSESTPEISRHSNLRACAFPGCTWGVSLLRQNKDSKQLVKDKGPQPRRRCSEKSNERYHIFHFLIGASHYFRINFPHFLHPVWALRHPYASFGMLEHP